MSLYALTLEGPNTDNYIKMYLDSDKSVWIEKYYIDRSHSNQFDVTEEFCKLLVSGFNQMKNRGGLTHKQYILRDEFDQFMKKDDRWHVITEDSDTLLIECDIEHGARCIIESFFGNSL